jgi:hypothetical protein
MRLDATHAGQDHPKGIQADMAIHVNEPRISATAVPRIRPRIFMLGHLARGQRGEELDMGERENESMRCLAWGKVRIQAAAWLI